MTKDRRLTTMILVDHRTGTQTCYHPVHCQNCLFQACHRLSSRPQRIRHKPTRYTPTYMAKAKKMLPKKVNTFDTPTLLEGMSRDDSYIGRTAVQTEVDTLKARGTWELVPRPPRTRVLPSKIALQIKRRPKDVDRSNARLVALSCLQREDDCDETFAPVVDFTPVRIALSLAIHERCMCLTSM
jgi:hypothetical protein